MSTRPAIAEYPAEAPADHAEWVSETDYWCHYYADADRPYEWNNGRLEEKPVSDQGTYLVYLWFVELLRHYLREHPLGQLAALEMGFRLALPDRTVIRRPDLGLVLAANPAPLLPLDRSYHGIFDLCVEALSDEDRASIDRDLVTKKAEYAAAGVPEYYILHRTDGQLGFFGLNPTGVYQAIVPVDGVIQSRVLPGFQFRIDDLKRQPDPDRLLDDPVYPFVLPGWREADRRAAAAEAQAAAAAERAAAEAQRAELEAERADATEQRAQAAEREVARLRAQAECNRPSPPPD
jgi:hypothetical protein